MTPPGNLPNGSFGGAVHASGFETSVSRVNWETGSSQCYKNLRRSSRETPRPQSQTKLRMLVCTTRGTSCLAALTDFPVVLVQRASLLSWHVLAGLGLCWCARLVLTNTGSAVIVSCRAMARVMRSCWARNLHPLPTWPTRLPVAHHAAMQAALVMTGGAPLPLGAHVAMAAVTAAAAAAARGASARARGHLGLGVMVLAAA